MNIKKKLGGSVLLAAVVLLSSAPANAYGPEGLFGGRPAPDSSLVLGNPVELKNDRPERAESVLEHPRPDFDAAPIEMGSFELFPTLELGATYDSNIYAEKNNEKEDAIGTIRPIVNLFSNWGRHALAVTAFGDSNYYSEHADENYNNALIDVNGRYDIENQTWLSARTGYQRLAETRTSPEAVNGSEPTTFGVGKAGLTGYRGVGKVKVTADYDYKRFDYDDTPADNGITIDQTMRDRDEHLMGGKVSYDITPNMKPYVRGTYNIRSYDHNATHDSDGYNALVGVEADFGGITSIDVFAGWMEQYYDDFAAKKKVSTPRIGGRMEWNVTGLTSVVLEADRTIEETSMTAFNSYYQTGGSATITHELRRNILLEGNGSFSHSDFNGADREDDAVSAGLGGRYLINRNLYSDLLYNWERRYSTEDTTEYTRNMVTLRLGVRL